MDELPSSYDTTPVRRARKSEALFLARRTGASLAAGSGRIPLTEQLLLTFRLELRIRYLVKRDGNPLAANEAFAQMMAEPFIGLVCRV